MLLQVCQRSLRWCGPPCSGRLRSLQFRASTGRRTAAGTPGSPPTPRPTSSRSAAAYVLLKHAVWPAYSQAAESWTLCGSGCRKLGMLSSPLTEQREFCGSSMESQGRCLESGYLWTLCSSTLERQLCGNLGAHHSYPVSLYVAGRGKFIHSFLSI